MTTVVEPAGPEPVVSDEGAAIPAAAVSPAAPTLAPVEDAPPAAPALMVIASSALAAAGAAWMTGGLFRDALARGVGMAGVLLAALMFAAATRLARPALVQYLVLPAAALLGGALMLPDSGAGTSSIPSLIGEAVRNGGVLQPPMPFDPGWKFIVVVLFAGVTAAGASLALSTDRPRLGVIAAVPVTVLTAIVQPDNAVVVSAVGAIVLMSAALALAYGAELSRSGGLSLQFETNRLLRGGALVLVLAIGLGLISRTGLLFPQTQRSYVSPPQKPQLPPPVADHVLLTVKFSGPGNLKAPLREGVLDTYDAGQQAWLLPAYDTHRFVDIAPPADLPAARRGAAITATITIADGGGGHVVPTIPNASRVGGGGDSVLQFDPQTEDLQLRDKPAGSGYDYALTSALPPTAVQLRAAAVAPPSMSMFLSVPRPPAAITALLTKAPAIPFDRMQYVRQQLYNAVTAAGTGVPVDVSVDRVAQMLRGGKATPFEIIAAEALLTRYAGVPSRIGYGYIGGDPTPDGSFAVHPSHGAAWLEAYFTGYGWTAIVGAPPHAQTALNQSQQGNSSIHPSNDLALVVYVPVRVHTFLAFYQQARYWLGVTLPVVVTGVLAVLLLPLGARLLRRRRRQRWADARGVLARIGVAYADLRDTATDLGVGNAGATPLEFVAAVEPDAEHAELAWLVTRAFWGDLRRDLRGSDAAAAEALSRSVARRLAAGQPMITRIIASMSRSSLRRPFSDEIPNVWFAPRRPGPRRRWRLRIGGRTLWQRRLLTPVGAGLMTTVMVAGLAMAGVAQASGAPVVSAADTTLARLVPASIGELTLQRERTAEAAYRQAGPDALVSAGQVYTVHQGPAVQASVQVSLLKAEASPRDPDFVHGLQDTIGGGNFGLLAVHVPIFDGHCRCAATFHDVVADQLADHFHQRIYITTIPDQRIYFWFPAGDRTLVILVVRDAIGTVAADDLALSLVDFQHGAGTELVPVPPLPVAPAASPTAASGIGTP